MTPAEQQLMAERLRELLDYNPETGVFTWKVRQARCIHVGAIAGVKNSNGYIQIKISSGPSQVTRSTISIATGPTIVLPI